MKFKRVFATITAIALLVSMMSITAFADPIKEVGPGEVAEVSISKTVTTGTGTVIPELTYTFNIEQITTGTEATIPDGAPGSTTTYQAETQSLDLPATITAKPNPITGKTGQDGANDLYQVDTNNILADFYGTTPAKTVPAPQGTGIYVYKITESDTLDATELAAWGGTKDGAYKYIKPSPASTTPGEINETLTMSQAAYLMYIYTKEDPNNAGSYYISAITVQQITYDNGTSASGNGKVDPTPGDPAVSGDFSDLVFVNKYVQAKVPSTDPDEAAYALSKRVTGVDQDAYILHGTGAANNRAKEFEFDVTITKPASDTAVAYTGLFWKSDNGTSWVERDIDGTIGQDSQVFTFTGNTATGTVMLAHNEKITFPDLPLGTQIEVVEADYSASFTTPDPSAHEYNFKAYIDGSTVASTDRKATATVVAAGASNSYTNDAQTGTTPAGIIVQYLPFFVIIALAVIGLVAFVVVKGRRRGMAC